MNELRSRPMIFSGPMCRALLAGTKSQTRRVVKPQPPPREDGSENLYPYRDGWRYTDVDYPYETFERCPYGAQGTELWVKETWARNAHQTSDDRMDTSIVYRADGNGRAVDNGEELSWHSPIFMPRRFSRITLRITDIRVERLRNISEADAIAEGSPAVSLHSLDCDSTPPREHFRKLWESIHGAESWVANPLVWVIGVEKVTP